MTDDLQLTGAEREVIRRRPGHALQSLGQVSPRPTTWADSSAIGNLMSYRRLKSAGKRSGCLRQMPDLG